MQDGLYSYRKEFKRGRLASIYAGMVAMLIFIPAGAYLAVVINNLLIENNLIVRVLMSLIAFVVITFPAIAYTYQLQRKRVVHIDVSDNHLIFRLCIGKISIPDDTLLKAGEEKHFLWGEAYRIYYRDDGKTKSIYMLEADLEDYEQYKKLIDGIIET